MQWVTSRPTRPITKQVGWQSIGCYSSNIEWRDARRPRSLDKALLWREAHHLAINTGMRAYRLEEAVVKLGRGNKGPADAFLKDFIEMTDDHPFDNRARILAGNVIHMSRRGSRVHLHDISSLDPGKGNASAAMRMLQRLAKEHNVIIELFAKAYRDDRMSTEKLVQWYQRLGFQTVDDTDKIDFDYGVEMCYYP